MSIPAIDNQAGLLKRAAEEASATLSRWLGRPTRIVVRRAEWLPVERAVDLLGADEEPLVACVMQIRGLVAGLLVLACDDASGLALADMLLGREPGTATEWGELERSAAVETANIIGCGYLNAIAAAAGGDSAAGDPAALPTPPGFVRDFAAAVMETIMLSQDAPAAALFLTHTDFLVEESPVTCSLVFLPEPADG